MTDKMQPNPVKEALEAWQRINMAIQKMGGFSGWAQNTKDMELLKRTLTQFSEEKMGITQPAIPEGMVLVERDILEVMHQHEKLAYGNYDYQCGFLDSLKLCKGLLKSAPVAGNLEG